MVKYMNLTRKYPHGTTLCMAIKSIFGNKYEQIIHVQQTTSVPIIYEYYVNNFRIDSLLTEHRQCLPYHVSIFDARNPIHV